MPSEGSIRNALDHGYATLRTRLHEETTKAAAESLANRREDPQDSSALAKKAAVAKKKVDTDATTPNVPAASPKEKGIDLPSSFDKRALNTTIHTQCAWLVPRVIMWGPSPASDAEARDISLITSAFAFAANDVLLSVFDVLTPAQVTKAKGSEERPVEWDAVDDSFVNYSPVDLSSIMVGNRFSDMATLSTTYLNDVVAGNDNIDSLVDGNGGGSKVGVGYVCCGDGQLGSAVVSSVLLSILHHPTNLPPLKAATIVGRLHAAREDNSGVEITLVRAGGSGGSASQGVQWCGVAHAFLSSMAVKPFLKDVVEAAYREPAPPPASGTPGPSSSSRLQIIRQSRSSVVDTSDLSPTQLFNQFKSILPCCVPPTQVSTNAAEFLANEAPPATPPVEALTPQHLQQQRHAELSVSSDVPFSKYDEEIIPNAAEEGEEENEDNGSQQQQHQLQHQGSNSHSNSHLQPPSLSASLRTQQEDRISNGQGTPRSQQLSTTHSNQATPTQSGMNQQHRSMHQQPQQQQQQQPEEVRPATSRFGARRGTNSGGGDQHFNIFGGGEVVDDRFSAHNSQSRMGSRAGGGMAAGGRIGGGDGGATRHVDPFATNSSRGNTPSISGVVSLDASMNSHQSRSQPVSAATSPAARGGGGGAPPLTDMQLRRKSQMTSSISFGYQPDEQPLKRDNSAAVLEHRRRSQMSTIQYQPDADMRTPQTNLARRGSAVAESNESPWATRYAKPDDHHHDHLASSQASSHSSSTHHPQQQQPKPQHGHHSHPPQQQQQQQAPPAGQSPPPTRGPRQEANNAAAPQQQQQQPIVAVLPPLLNANAEEARIRGPTSKTNWVIPGAVLCGPMPDVPHDLFEEGDALDSSAVQYGRKGTSNRIPRRPLIKELTNLGVTTIVSLIASGGVAREMVQSYSRLAEMNGSDGVVRHIHVSMEDGAPIVASNRNAFGVAVMEAADIIRAKFSGDQQQQGCMYIHCLGGHGRTGMFVTALLAELYPLELGCSGMKAANFCNRLHGARLDTEGRSSPETQEQRMSVMTFVDNIRKTR